MYKYFSHYFYSKKIFVAYSMPFNKHQFIIKFIIIYVSIIIEDSPFIIQLQLELSLNESQIIKI